MKKEVLILILLLSLLIIPLAYSSDNKKLWSGEVYSGEIINISNQEFKFVISSYEEKLSVTFPDNSSRWVLCSIKPGNSALNSFWVNNLLIK